MANISSPCQFCKQRVQNCHSNCQKYIDFSAQAEELRQQRHQEIESKGIIINSVARSRKGHKIII